MTIASLSFSLFAAVQPVSELDLWPGADVNQACDNGRCTAAWLENQLVDKHPHERVGYEELDTYFRLYMSEHRSLFGVKASGVSLQLERVSEDSINDIPRTSLSYIQSVNGYRVDDGEIIASFANNILIAVHGEPVTDDDLAGRRPLVRVEGAAPCDSRATATMFSRRYGGIIQRRDCGKTMQIVDEISGAVIEESDSGDKWTPTTTYINSIVTPTYGARWFGPAPGTVPATFHVIGSVVSCPEGQSCNTPRKNWWIPADYENGQYRLTYC